MPVTLIEVTAYDPVAAAAVILRACNADDHRVTALNGQRWWPVLARAPQRRLDLFDGDFSGRVGVGLGDLEISTKAHPNAPRWSWGERPITIWRGPLGGAWGDYVQVFKGLTGPARGQAGRLTIGLRPDDRWLDKPLLPTYAGTGGAEGPAELKGVAKPLAIGAPQFVPGVLINRTLNIWQISAFRIRSVVTALDRLARFSGGAYDGDSADYAALASATIAAGKWRSCIAAGLVRFGAPVAVPSFIIEGDDQTAGLGWVRRPGAVIRRIAEIAGAVSGQVNTTSLAALDTWAAALPSGGNISLNITQQSSARDVIQQIAASCNAAAGIGFDGALFVARVGIGTPTATLDAAGSRAPAVRDVALLETSAPFWRLAMAAEPTWRVHSEGEYGQIGVADQITYPNGTLVSALQPAAAGADVTVDQPVVSRLSDVTGQALANFVANTGNPFAQLVASGEARDGDTVSFPTTLPSVPRIFFLPGGKSVTADNIRIEASGLSTTGFSMIAKSQTVTPGSTITDGSATTGSTGEPDRIINRTNSGVPFDGRFTYRFTITVGLVGGVDPGFAEIALFAKKSGAWVEVGRESYNASGTYNRSVTPGTVDFGAGAEFGVSLVYAEGTGTALTGFTHVQYTLGTVTEASLTPGNAGPIPWQAFL